jgi:hypothetical protein
VRLASEKGQDWFNTTRIFKVDSAKWFETLTKCRYRSSSGLITKKSEVQLLEHVIFGCGLCVSDSRGQLRVHVDLLHKLVRTGALHQKELSVTQSD